MSKTYRVKEVAQLSGVSVRTLHHYDAIGLLVPKRSVSDYRLYSDGDILRLQQILISRQLGLSLESIRHSLDDPNFDNRRALVKQRQQLVQREHETQLMIAAIDMALDAIEPHTPPKEIDMNRIFRGFSPEAYETETAERWGTSDAYLVSQRRTKSYSEEQWKSIQVAQLEIYTAMAQVLATGVQPDSEKAMEIAERHRRCIDQWFYPCSHNHHCALAQMYEVDGRFASNIDAHGKGLSAFLSRAIQANAQAHK